MTVAIRNYWVGITNKRLIMCQPRTPYVMVYNWLSFGLRCQQSLKMLDTAIADSTNLRLTIYNRILQGFRACELAALAYA